MAEAGSLPEAMPRWPRPHSQEDSSAFHLHTCLLTLEDDGALTSSLGNTSNNLMWNTSKPSFSHSYCGLKEEEREDIYYFLVNIKGSLFIWVCDLVC